MHSVVHIIEIYTFKKKIEFKEILNYMDPHKPMEGSGIETVMLLS